MTQRQITNHKSDNLFVLIGSTRVWPEIILKSRQLKYKRSVYMFVYNTPYVDQYVIINGVQES